MITASLLELIDTTIVTKQTYLLTYTDAYWVAGLIMLCSVPLLYLLKFKKNTHVPTDVH
ncbi:hypothetical protein [Pontibacter rugosus]|uniref:Uncharacterized protein n=1 Tax=Pontibacter rugosus TaxID=1745966 RepID=A0ABW3SXW7_9BACT